MNSLIINDLHHTEELDASAMASVIGGEKALPEEKPIKLTYDHGDIIGEWADGTKIRMDPLGR